MKRLTNSFTVYYIEEPIYGAVMDHSILTLSKEMVWVLIPHLKGQQDEADIHERMQRLIDQFIQESELDEYLCWYYTPMALEYTRHLDPVLTVYDCMDELAAFRFAPENIVALESELFGRADLVFAGGNSLYEAKRNRHEHVQLFPSSIDFSHFSKARNMVLEPADQQDIPFPRIGFFGVLDERLDVALLEKVARARPNWQLVLLGPTAKIDPETLPKAPNIHYLGIKPYEKLPDYVGGWQLAMIPFALNESTRFTSPTKTPEYLAAGRPVISTPIADVVHPYGTRKLVHIADTADAFVKMAEEELCKEDRAEWLKEVDEYLSQLSWDSTIHAMLTSINHLLENRLQNDQQPKQEKQHV